MVEMIELTVRPVRLASGGVKIQDRGGLDLRRHRLCRCAGLGRSREKWRRSTRRQDWACGLLTPRAGHVMGDVVSSAVAGRPCG